MKPRVKKMFQLIKTQLMDKEHPLNILSREFVESYVEHYSTQIIEDMQ